MNLVRFLSLVITLLIAPLCAAGCPALLQHEMKVLHRAEVVNLCERFANKPLLVINTASYCGFTPQFKQLEALYLRYKDKGVEFIGVASNSFNQEDSDEAKTASICYVNYGVSFTMLAPVAVKGDKAHPLFQQLAVQSQPPQWNFNKYLVDSNGNVLRHYASSELPTADDLDNLIAQNAEVK